MNHTETAGSWDRIQSGVRETERLIGQKKYNMAMVKARETLEFMVKNLCEKSGVQGGSLIDMIDALYEAQIINKTTCEHYHKIRTIGNKAIHEEDNSAYNANQAHHLLSQEVYTFANDYKEPRRHPARRPAAPEGRSRSRAAAASRRRPAAPPIDFGSIAKPLLLIGIIILLIVIIVMLRPDGEKPVPAESPAVTETESSSSAETAVPDQQEAEGTRYKTLDTLNVRPAPSTEDARIGVLAPDTEVIYLRDYDERWGVIRFEGGEAYVVREYLTPVNE